MERDGVEVEEKSLISLSNGNDSNLTLSRYRHGGEVKLLDLCIYIIIEKERAFSWHHLMTLALALALESCQK